MSEDQLHTKSFLTIPTLCTLGQGIVKLHIDIFYRFKYTDSCLLLCEDITRKENYHTELKLNAVTIFTYVNA